MFLISVDPSISRLNVQTLPPPPFALLRRTLALEMLVLSFARSLVRSVQVADIAESIVALSAFIKRIAERERER